ARVNHSRRDRLEPATGLRQRRGHELLDQIDDALLAIEKKRSGGITALENEPPYLPAHASVIAREPQSRLIDLEEIVEHAPAVDDFDLRHYSALRLAARITLAHFSVSSTISFPKSADEPRNGIPPRSASRAPSLGSERPALTSLLS